MQLFFVAGTGLDNSDPHKANYDRSKATIELTGSTTTAVVILVCDDESNVNQHIQVGAVETVLTYSPCMALCLERVFPTLPPL